MEAGSRAMGGPVWRGPDPTRPGSAGKLKPRRRGVSEYGARGSAAAAAAAPRSRCGAAAARRELTSRGSARPRSALEAAAVGGGLAVIGEDGVVEQAVVEGQLLTGL